MKALIEFPQFRDIGDTLDVSQFISNPQLSEDCARAVGFQIGKKIALVISQMHPGDILQIGQIVGVDFSPPLSGRDSYNQLALFSGSFRREISVMILRTVIDETAANVSFIDSRQKNRPHPDAQLGLHLTDDAIGPKDHHTLSLQLEKLEGLSWFEILKRYPFVALERLLPQR